MPLPHPLHRTSVESSTQLISTLCDAFCCCIFLCLHLDHEVLAPLHTVCPIDPRLHAQRIQRCRPLRQCRWGPTVLPLRLARLSLAKLPIPLSTSAFPLTYLFCSHTFRCLSIYDIMTHGLYVVYPICRRSQSDHIPHCITIRIPPPAHYLIRTTITIQQTPKHPSSPLLSCLPASEGVYGGVDS